MRAIVKIRDFIGAMNPRLRVIFFIEIVIGLLILAGGIFLLAAGNHEPTQAVMPTPSLSVYVSSPLQITLKYPSAWQIDPAFNGIPGIERYQGTDGYFQVDATNDPMKRAGRLIMKYPKPITLGTTKYRYFVLYADAGHLKSIGDTVEFMNK